ncbi:MAG: hypothetical protein LBE09_07385, partial [Christensenellaceae bacterium]|nr:hypothetical protein [Christensenellaceae bacterium]
MRNAKKCLATVLSVILLSTIFLVSLSACTGLDEILPFDKYTKMIFEEFIDGDGLTINLLLDDPSVYDFDSCEISIAKV